MNWSDGQPLVRVWDDGARTSHHVPLVGLQLNYRAPDPLRRRCLGHRAFGAGGAVFIDCERQPKPKAKKCVRCGIHDASFAANIHHAHTKDRSGTDKFVAEHLAKKNYLYLAGFRDGSIKVGTSTAHRREARLLEQGAWVAAVVAEANDGYVVREIEDHVTEFLQVSQSVSGSRKLSGHQDPVSDVELIAQLDGLAEKVRALADALADKRLTSVAETWSNPMRLREHAAVVRYPLDPTVGAHDLEILDACGRIVFCSRTTVEGARDPEVFTFDLGTLFGVELELGAFAPDEATLQTSLF